MRITLDKTLPSYQEYLNRMQRMFPPPVHPRGVFCFKTFAEFNEWKEKYKVATGSVRDKNVGEQADDGTRQ